MKCPVCNHPNSGVLKYDDGSIRAVQCPTCDFSDWKRGTTADDVRKVGELLKEIREGLNE